MSPRCTHTPMANCLPAFGRHRGYPPRYGWLRKVYDALLRDPTALRRPDATLLLGVGKSMCLERGSLAPEERGEF